LRADDDDAVAIERFQERASIMPEQSFGQYAVGLLGIFIFLGVYVAVLSVVFHYLTPRWLTERLSRGASIFLDLSFAIWTLGLLSKFTRIPGVGMVSFPSSTQMNFEGICDIFGAVWMLMLLSCFVSRYLSPHVSNTNAGLIDWLKIDTPVKRLMWVGTLAFGAVTFLVYVASLYAETRSHLGDDYSPTLDQFQEDRWFYLSIPGVPFLILFAALLTSPSIGRLLSWIRHGE
jgi:hypothetical protein